MRNSIFSIPIIIGIITGTAMAQPVSDRAVIPMGVTFQQILRIHVVDGGNIEFVFNGINDYKNGIPNSTFYTSSVVVASSTNWQLHLGAEDATLIGTDNPARTLALNNVGFMINWLFSGANTCCFPGFDNVALAPAYSDADANPNGLKPFTGTAADLLFTDGGGGGSGGDILDNAFLIQWQCGTQSIGSVASPMNAVSILKQSPPADRYVTNAFLDLEAL